MTISVSRMRAWSKGCWQAHQVSDGDEVKVEDAAKLGYLGLGAIVVKSSTQSGKEATHHFAVKISAVESVQHFPSAGLDHVGGYGDWIARVRMGVCR